MGGFRSIKGDLWLAPRGGNLSITDIVSDHGVLQLENGTPNIIVHGDLQVKSNTEDTTDNIGIGNISADGNLNVTGDIEAINGVILTASPIPPSPLLMVITAYDWDKERLVKTLFILSEHVTAIEKGVEADTAVSGFPKEPDLNKNIPDLSDVFAKPDFLITILSFFCP